MKKTRVICLGVLLLATTACVVGVKEADVEKRDTFNEQISVTALTSEAETKYAEYLSAGSGNRMAAAEKTAKYLKTVPGIEEVKVLGSDTLMVIFTDGNELLLMLGTHRL